MVGVMEQIQPQTGGAKGDYEFGRFLDESVIDDLEREGFFKKIPSRTAENDRTSGSGQEKVRVIADEGDTGWDEETDVVMLGCGGAGAVAAITAWDAGASCC